MKELCITCRYAGKKRQTINICRANPPVVKPFLGSQGERADVTTWPTIDLSDPKEGCGRWSPTDDVLTKQSLDARRREINAISHEG